MADGQISLREGLRSRGKDAFIAHLHEDAPLFRDAGGFWVASKFSDVRAILLDHTRFSSAAMGSGSGSGGRGFPLLSDDPPRHSVLRGLLSKAFTPASIAAMRPGVEALARELVARIPAGEEVDVVGALTAPLPVAVIAGMMGVPAAEHANFRRWSSSIVGLQDDPLGAERMKTLMELREYFGGLAAARRAAPGEDLISALTKVSDTTETLSDDQVVGFAILLMIAGNETTTNLLGNLLDCLAGSPEDWAALRAAPALREQAIEESLRVDSPAQMVMRRARADVQLGGASIQAGDTVVVYLAAANRDPAKWSHPELFDVERELERHLAFGHGVHVCIGAPLARLEARAALDALLERFTALSRGSLPGVRITSGILFGFRSLPVVLV